MFRTQYNYKVTDLSFEKCIGPSMTIQGDSYSIKELMQKHLLGQLPNVGREAIYNGGEDMDFDMEKVRDMDLAERDEVKIINSQRISELRQKLEVKDSEPEKVQPEPE